MFEPAIMDALLRRHHAGLGKLVGVEASLKQRFFGMDVQIRALVLAAAAGEPLLMIGEPGTGKSRLIRAFCELTGVSGELPSPRNPKRHGYFEYLLTQFTEPSELFGFYDIAAFGKGEGQLRRIDDGMMQHAQVVFLDEVFNANSSILNSLLAFINERRFHDRGLSHPVEMRLMLAATNDNPGTPELRAFYDRFLLRCYVENVGDDRAALTQLIGRAWQETYSRHGVDESLEGVLEDMLGLRVSIEAATEQGQLQPLPGSPVYAQLMLLITNARRYSLSQVSNRRIVKLVHLMLIHRLYRAVAEDDDKDLRFGPPELNLFRTYFLDEVDPVLTAQMDKVAYEVA